MNDSFLEDLDLVPKNEKKRSHITTRNATSSPLQRFTEPDDFAILQQQSNESPKTEQKDYAATKMVGKDFEQDARKQHTKTKVTERKEKTMDYKVKSVENRVKPETREKENKIDNKVIQQEIKARAVESKVTVRERSRRSGSHKENSHCSDSFVKESSRQIDLSKDNNLQSDSKNTQRRSEIKESDPVVLLNAIKDLVSTYTKQESTKVLKAMKELHVNSQATFIKTTLLQTEELIKEMHPSRDSTRMKALIEENERLREDIIILKKRNEDLQKRLEELQLVKQENISLKLKCKELCKS